MGPNAWLASNSRGRLAAVRGPQERDRSAWSAKLFGLRVFDLPAVRRSFDADTIARGVAYCDEGRVLSWQTNAEYVVGEVRGAGRAPYVVTLTAAMSKSGVWLTGRCSCPVGRNCKHAAALAFAILRHPDEETHGGPSTSLGMTKSALGMTGDAALRQAQGDNSQPQTIEQSFAAG